MITVLVRYQIVWRVQCCGYAPQAPRASRCELYNIQNHELHISEEAGGGLDTFAWDSFWGISFKTHLNGAEENIRHIHSARILESER